MKRKTAALAAYGLLLVCLAFTMGYLVGQGSGETQVQVTTAPQALESAPAEETVVQQPVVEASPAEPEPEPPTAEKPLDLNTAEQAQLELLPGIGPELAGRIIAYRQANGAFVSKEQLMDVEGIGEKRYAEIEPLIIIGGKQ